MLDHLLWLGNELKILTLNNMFPIFSESEITYRSIRRSVKIVFEMYNNYN